MPYDINSRHNQIARSIFGLVGASNPLDLEDLIHAVVVLEGERADRSFAAGERYWAGHHVIAAGGAGVRTEILIRNPPGSGILSTVIGVFMDAGGFIGWVDVVNDALPPNFGAALNLIHPVDHRFFGPGGSGSVKMTTTVHTKNVGIATGIFELGLIGSANKAWTVNRDVIAIMEPGAAIALQASVDNQGISAAWFGREVPFITGGERG